MLKTTTRALLPALLVLAAARPARSDDDRPNVVLILADDLGYADLGFQGCEDIRTPRLDALAASGVICTSGYSSHPFCSPMRAGLMTGRYQQRFGYESNIPYAPQNDFVGLDKKQPTVARRLQRAGYTTAGVGKWHLGAAHPFHPLKRGFDHYYGFLGGGHDYFEVDLTRPLSEGYRDALQRDGKPEDLEGYLTDRLTDAAVDFIKAHAGDDRPFFLYLAYNAPHTPMQAPAGLLGSYQTIANKKRKAYAAMVTAMDTGIGRVVDALAESRAREETLVFFFSDNGGPEHANASDNGVLRGGKGDVFEGGVRVPYIVSWPGTLPPGKRHDSPVNSLDAACTALALAGIDISDRKQFDGIDLVPQLRGDGDGGTAQRPLFWRKSGGGWAVRAGRWKLAMAGGAKNAELFDLEADLGESEDLAAANPERVSELRALYSTWDAENIPNQLPGFRDYHPAMREVYQGTIGR